MDHRIHQLQNHPLSYQKARQSNGKPTSNEKSFQSFLNEAQTTLTVSKHAQKRLSERNIQINDSQWSNIQTKMEQAKTKGVTDSLVVLNDATLVVSTKNNTVITAMDRQEATEHLFTNINGTIILND